MAQNVQVYGILDGGVSRVTGVAGGNKNSVVSGIMDGSRLGFKGSEDLGAGYKAVFTLEHRLELDTGGISSRPPSGSQVPDRLSSAALLGLPGGLQPVVTSVSATLGSQIGTNLANNFWDRQVFVGLVTPFGGFLAGRQYTPAYEVAAAFDTTGTQSSLAAGQAAAFPPSVDIRASNAVAYRLQMGPVSGVAMYAPDESSTTTGHFKGINAMYKADAFSVGAGYNLRKNELGEDSLSTFLVGLSAKAGPGTILGFFARVKDDHPSGLSSLPGQLTPQIGAVNAALIHNAFVEGLRQDARKYHLGYRFTTGPHTIYTAATAWDDRRPGNSDVLSYGGVYTYAFSKRTDLNFVLTHFDNKRLAQAAPGQAGFVGGVTSSAGTDSTNVALGVRHRF